jgi:hypothetical protein
MTLRNAIILFIITCILCVAFMYIKEGIITSTSVPIKYQIVIDSLNYKIDSLNNEVFYKEMTIGKYDIAIELLKEQDPDAADKFELILKNQTE